MGIFLSIFKVCIDGRDRVSIPARFREVLPDENLVLFKSFKEEWAIEGMSMQRMEKLSESVDVLNPIDASNEDVITSIFSNAHHLRIDDNGRVMLKSELKEAAGLRGMVLFVGRGKTFQIWDPERFTEHQKRAEAATRHAVRK